MNRRAFIINQLANLSAVSLAPMIASACQTDTPTWTAKDKTVVIVGAGIAGLAAAKKLHELGYKVIVLEAQEKVGGRLRTNRSLGLAFDEGASWIHGIDKNPISTLAQQAKMETFFTDDTSIVSYDLGGSKRSSSLYTRNEEEFFEVLGSLMRQGSANESFETVFRKIYPNKTSDRLWKFFLSAFVTFDTGDLNLLSSLLYDEGEEFGGVEKIATNGYDTLANYLATGLDVRLKQPVSSIDFSTNKPKVSHQGNTTEADYVLVTVPLGVLKANRIKFVPELPSSKRNAIGSVGMNCVNKFLLNWETPFWDNVQYITYTPEQPDKFNYFVNVQKYIPNSASLMTFAYAEYARYTEKLSDAEVTNEIMLHLKDMYGSKIPNPKHFLRTQWQSNEFSHGAYSFTAVGTQMRHFDDLAESVQNRLFFAGEHTHAEYFSTVHGAYLSGLREADKIIKLG